MARESLEVKSTAISRMEYDSDTQELVVTFARGGSTGGSYVISGIPEIEVQRWIASESPGRYFNANVKGKY